MKTFLKITAVISAGLLIFLVWPVAKQERESGILTKEKSPEQIKRIMIVYNANADHPSVLKDFFHKIFAPDTYPCNLCRLAFGVFTVHKEWKNFLDSLPYEKQLLHKDEFEEKYNIKLNGYPVILGADDKNIWIIVSTKEINNCTTLSQMIAITKQKLNN